MALTILTTTLVWVPVQDRIRAQHREVLRLAQRVHPTPRLVEYLSLGLASKSSRTRIEAIEALAEILAAEGLAPFERAREKPFPVISQACSTALLQAELQPCSMSLIICAVRCHLITQDLSSTL